MLVPELSGSIPSCNSNIAKTTRLATEKTAPAKTNGSCGKCGKCVKTDTEGDKKKLADSGYYSSAYINLNGKEFYSEGADSWNDVKKAVREYFEKLQGKLDK